MATHSSILAWRIQRVWVAKSWTRLSDFHFSLIGIKRKENQDRQSKSKKAKHESKVKLKIKAEGMQHMWHQVILRTMLRCPALEARAQNPVL